MELTKKQRKKCIELIIQEDTEQLKPKDIFYSFYNGISPYKDMSDKEIIEYYKEMEIALPTK